MIIGRCLWCRRPEMELYRVEIPDVSTANRMVLFDLCEECRDEQQNRGKGKRKKPQDPEG